MFSKLVTTPKSSKTKAKATEMHLTTAFLKAVVKEGARLSYAALAGAAAALGEDSSTQIPAQRGAAIVKTLPESLQPHVCRKSGGYHSSVVWSVEVPTTLRSHPVIIATNVAQAVKEWQKAEAEAQEAEAEG